MTNKYIKHVMVNLDAETYLKVKASADRAKLPVSTYIRTLIVKEGNEHDGNK